MVNSSWPGERTQDRLAPELRIALAYTPPAHRPGLEALFAFDAMLSRFVIRSSEPLLVQMRLAWWREQLSQAVGPRIAADPVLQALRTHYVGEERALVALVDGWEGILAGTALSVDTVGELTRARASAIGGFASLAGAVADRARAEHAGMLWALADVANLTHDRRELDVVRSLTPDSGEPLPRRPELRGIAVLGGLARRALRRRRPLMDGRLAALAAFRLGVLAR